MHRLYHKSGLVGEIDSEGTICRVDGRRREPLGRIEADGAIFEDDRKIGYTDGTGDVMDNAGGVIGRVSKRVAYRARRRVGSVTGPSPLLYGAGFVPFFPYDDEEEEKNVPWIVIILALVAFVVAVIFLIASSFIWLPMVLITCVFAPVIAHLVARSLSDSDIAELVVEETAGRNRAVRRIAAGSVARYAGYPYLLLAVSPSLLFGLVMTCASIRQDRASIGNAVLALLALAFGAAVSTSVARKLLKWGMGSLLLRAVDCVASTRGIVPCDWRRVARYAALGLVGVAAVGAAVCALPSGALPVQHAAPARPAPAVTLMPVAPGERQPSSNRHSARPVAISSARREHARPNTAGTAHLPKDPNQQWREWMDGMDDIRPDESIRRLVESGDDVNLCHDGWSVLTMAARSDDTVMVKALLAAGARPDNPNPGFTPLMATALNGDPAMADYLLSHGASPDIKDDTGATALAYAAACKFRESQSRYLAVAKVILAHNGRTGLRDNAGKTAADVARVRGFEDMASLLDAHASAAAGNGR